MQVVKDSNMYLTIMKVYTEQLNSQPNGRGRIAKLKLAIWFLEVGTSAIVTHSGRTVHFRHACPARRKSYAPVGRRALIREATGNTLGDVTCVHYPREH